MFYMYDLIYFRLSDLLGFCYHCLYSFYGIKINIYFSIFQIDTTNTSIACELSVHSNTKRNVIYVFIFTPDILDRILDSK